MYNVSSFIGLTTIMLSLSQDKTIYNLEDAVPVLPDAACYYEAPDPCTGNVPQSCCEKLGLQGGAPALSVINFVLSTLLFVLASCLV